MTEDGNHSFASFSHVAWSIMFGIGVFLAIFGWEIVDPEYIDWLMQDDSATHFLGWHFFRFEPWGFPLGKINNYLYPEGTSLVYTDSIPLVSIPMKLFSQYLSPNFQFKGLLILFSYILQGYFSCLLLSRFVVNRYLITLGVCFFLFSPALFWRTIDQETLANHWIVIAAIYLYFEKYDLRSKFKWLFLIVISLLTHFYLYFQVVALFSGYLLKSLTGRVRANISSAIFIFGMSLCLAVLTMWVVGYFIIDVESSVGGGYGHFSLNLLSPFHPFPQESLFITGKENLPRPGGLAYFGLGMIFLMIYVLISFCNCPKVGFADIKKIFPLVLISILLTIIAISNKISWGNYVIFEIDIPSFVTKALSVVRSSNRLFWPSYYLCMLASVVFVANNVKERKATILLGFCLIIQIFDLWPMYKKLEPGKFKVSSPLKSAYWQEIVENIDHIVLVPPTLKGQKYIHFAKLAADNRKTINLGYTARLDVKERHKYNDVLLNGVKAGYYQADALCVHVSGEYLFRPLGEKNKVSYGMLDGFPIVFGNREKVNLVDWPFEVASKSNEFSLSELVDNFHNKKYLFFLFFRGVNGQEVPEKIITSLNSLGKSKVRGNDKKMFFCIISEGGIYYDSRETERLEETYNFEQHNLKVARYNKYNPNVYAYYIDNIPYYLNKKNILYVIVLNTLTHEIEQYQFD